VNSYASALTTVTLFTARVVMDDHTHTRKTLDDLAELYLTGLIPPDQPSALQTPPPPINAPQTPPWHDGPGKTTVRQPPGSRPKLTITHPFINENAPDAHQALPQTRHTPSQNAPDTPQPDFALALASIARARQATHKTQAQRSEADIPAGGSPALVEAVFLGNLPGFSGPWLTQYAHYQAGRHGVIVVLSVEGDGVDVELIAPPGQSLDGLVERYAKSTHGSDSLADALRFLADGDAVDVGGWLVHFSAPIGLSVLHRARQMDRWTLLCGADDAAVVGAYRLLKQLSAQPTADSVKQPATQADRQIGVMVMGSDDSSGHIAAMKLNHTAGSFLDTPVQLVGCQKQMQPVNAQPLGYFTGGAEDDLWSLIHTFLETGDTGPHEPPAKSPQWVRPREDQPDEPGHQEEYDEMDDVLNDHTAVDPDLDLSRFMPDGFTPLEARCPHNSEAQLMLDRDGRVHVLMRDDGDSPTHIDAPLGAAVSDLLAVGRWVRQHLALLKLTQPGDTFDEQTDPVLHLFTDQPKAATALVGQLESLVKVHLLQQVHVGLAGTWHGCELN